MSERILICGSRRWGHRELIRRELAKLPTDTIIIHGDCPTGADHIADAIWRQIGQLAPEKFPADWKKHGKAAGPIRNQQMIDEGKPDRAIAFFFASGADADPSSPGTADMLRRVRAAGIPVLCVRWIVSHSLSGTSDVASE